VSAREEAARERRAARDERVAQASESLARFELVNKALSEEKDARVLVERKCRKELEVSSYFIPPYVCPRLHSTIYVFL
jgi:hypothetical protein